MGERVTLKIGAAAYEGWETVSIQRSLLALSGSFEVTLADQAGRDWSFGALQECAVDLGTTRVLTGFIDSVDISLGPEEHQVTVGGRDRTADLVDCAVVQDREAKPHPSTFKNQSLLALATAMVAPYGFSVEKRVGLGSSFRRFAIERGETVFEALDRACKLRGVVPVTDPWGRVILTAAGVERAADTLKYGVNVKAAKANFNYQNRFSHYRIETQVAGDGDVQNNIWGRAASLTATFKDAEVGAVRFRPTVLSADADATPDAAKRRLAAEALSRAANSETYEVTVSGWRQSDGSLWAVNQIVKVEIPALKLNRDMLIAQVHYQQSRSEGTTAALTLMRKDAFDTARILEAQQIREPAAASGRGIWTLEPKVPTPTPPAETSFGTRVVEPSL